MTTKSDIVDAVARKVGRTQAMTKDIVDATFDSIAASLAGGDEVRIHGFGVFDVRKTEARPGRNPRTGEVITIAAGKKIGFKASSELKGAI